MRSAIIAGVVLAALAIGALFYFGRPAATPPGLPPPAISSAPPPEASVATPDLPPPASSVPEHHPVPMPEKAAPLESSDEAIARQLGALAGNEVIARWLVPQQIIRRIVATVDNLDRGSLAQRLRPIKAVGGDFAVDRTDAGVFISARNAARYAALVAAVHGIDPARAAAWYLHDYPLFQDAYVQLGYPNGYFNDRLIAVLNHLLAAPQPTPPVGVLQPSVFYTYADAGLERLSFGQKALIRVGADQENALKDWLRDFRDAVNAAAPAAPR